MKGHECTHAQWDGALCFLVVFTMDINSGIHGHPSTNSLLLHLFLAFHDYIVRTLVTVGCIFFVLWDQGDDEGQGAGVDS